MRNVVARLHSQFAKALEEFHIFPRAILVVLDNDLIRHLQVDDEGLTIILKELIIWLFKEVDKLISQRKELLPKKSLKADYPQIFWMESPQHMNFVDNLPRRKFNSIVQSTATEYNYMKIVRMKKIGTRRKGCCSRELLSLQKA